MLNGSIPLELGNLSKTVTSMTLSNNQLTGFPTNFANFTPGGLILLPNPLATLSFDIMKKQPLSTVNEAQLVSFLTSPLLRKRQMLSTATAPYQSLYDQYCNVVLSTSTQDTVLGCIKLIAFICTVDEKQCQILYDRVFAKSPYSSLGADCPAWKNGPWSLKCNTTVNNFYSDLQYTQVTKTFAVAIQKNIFGNKQVAVCTGKVGICYW